MAFRSQAKNSLASWVPRSNLWPFAADAWGSASLLYGSMMLLGRRKGERSGRVPQEGAQMPLFHKSRLPPAPPPSRRRRRRSWKGTGRVAPCADRPETFLALRKIKEKKKTDSLENHCCSPRKISSALHSSVAISWLMTALGLDRRSIESLRTYSLFFSRLASNHSTKFFFSMLSIVRL